MRKHLILLNCTHEIVKIVNSVSGVFYHNEEKGGGWGRKLKLNKCCLPDTLPRLSHLILLAQSMSREVNYFSRL